MGLLENYREQNPEAFMEKPKWQAPKEYGFFIRLVMRMSGGRIRDINKAAYALAIAAAVMFVVSLFFSKLEAHQFLFSFVLTAIALATVGAVKGLVVRKHWIKSALETLIIGGVAATLAFLVGYFLRSLA